MDKRTLKVTFNKAGSGSITKRLTLPSKIIADMGISKEEPYVDFIYDKEKKEAIIRKTQDKKR